MNQQQSVAILVECVVTIAGIEKTPSSFGHKLYQLISRPIQINPPENDAFYSFKVHESSLNTPAFVLKHQISFQDKKAYLSNV